MNPKIIPLAILSALLFNCSPEVLVLLLFGPALLWCFLYYLGWLPGSFIKPIRTLLPKIIYYLTSL